MNRREFFAKAAMATAALAVPVAKPKKVLALNPDWATAEYEVGYCFYPQPESMVAFVRNAYTMNEVGYKPIRRFNIKEINGQRVAITVSEKIWKTQ